MAIHHASSGELIDIRPLQGDLQTVSTRTLYKSDHLEVFRLVILAGKGLPDHRVEGELTVQCLEGCIEMTASGRTEFMRSGDLMCLAGGVPHALKALEDSSVLVTLLLHTAQTNH